MKKVDKFCILIEIYKLTALIYIVIAQNSNVAVLYNHSYDFNNLSYIK